MENMFLCHHGDKDLKPGKGVINSLTESIKNCLVGENDLPIEVIRFYVRCRTFFRIRRLNRDITQVRNKKNIMKKIVT